MKPATILIVEDERIIAKGIEKRLGVLGYSVVGSTGSGETAIRLAAELRPDLVLMDIHLGAGMDGIEAAARIREALELPVVFLTAFSDDATLQRAKLTEPFGYILKPYEDKDLQTAIEIGLYRHRAERGVRENEQWLSATLGSIGDGVIATDAQGRVRFLNALAQRMTGWTQAEAAGRALGDVFRIVEETSRTPLPNPALEALATGAPAILAPNAILIDKTGGELPIEDSAAPIRRSNGQIAGAVLVFRDISERRKLEEHLRQTQKMEAIGRLAGGIAHDFNYIMTVILGFSDLLLSEGEFGESFTEGERRKSLEQIAASGKRAAELTRQIMAFSRKQTLVMGVVNPNSVVRDMGAMVKRLIGSDIVFHLELEPNLGSVQADPTQLGQLILNLAVNARDAMPYGGQLTIATANAEDDRVEIRVTDTGVGISETHLPKIFEPFFTTKRVGEGTGLGLATVWSIVEQGGGRIEVSSRLGVGTTFRALFPRVVERAMPTAGSPVAERRQGRETILLVEDEAAVRALAKTILRNGGYSVLEAADGKAALEVAARSTEPIHLLLTDVTMPHVSGRELAEQLSRTRPEMHILFMSGYTEDALLRVGIESRSVNFLAKPFRSEDLIRTIRELLDRV